MTNKSDSYDFAMNLFVSLKQAQYNGERVLKMDALYGRWGMTYAFQIGPYLSWIPPLITVILFIVFRRKKLLGVTQKFILSIMVADVIYTFVAFVRDTLLRAFEMHYGFLEYRVCLEVVYSFRFQMICHSTSVWLKSLMSLHQVLLVGFPLKVKLYNLSAGFYCFLIFHFIFCTMFLIVLNFPTIEPIPLIQEYRPGTPLRRVLGCRLAASDIFKTTSLTQSSALSTTVLLYTQVIPFVLHFFTIVALVILLTKHIRTLSILMNNISVERIKYLSLLKVNIGLGISFFLQELPVIFFSLYQVGTVSDKETHDNISRKYQGFAFAIMSISFCVGKPIDLIIYASLSKSFKEEIQGLLKCACKCRRKIGRKTEVEMRNPPKRA